MADSKFKVGDKVKFNDNISLNWWFKVGDIGTVTKILPVSFARDLPIRVLTKHPKLGEATAFVSADMIDLVEERKLAPQTGKVLDHLRAEGDISGIEAWSLYKVRSLTKRISELGKAGHPIQKEWKRDHTGQRYVRYTLKGAKA